MGKFNSSLTRLQSIFEALYETDPSGESWVESLLDLASRKESINLAATEITPGHLLKPPQFEFPVNPPKSLNCQRLMMETLDRLPLNECSE